MNVTKYSEIKYLRRRLFKFMLFMRRLSCSVCGQQVNSSQRKLNICNKCIRN